MAYPAELIRRAQEQRRQRRAVPQRENPAQELRPMTPSAPLQPHHGSYTRLMRSHDRVRTRHLEG